MLRTHTLLVLKNIFLILLFAFISEEFFFDAYRVAAFNITPHDSNYVEYILYFMGELTSPPESPFYYRIISVLIALPLVDLLPFFKFSALPADISDAHLKAIQALSFVTYVAAIITSILCYKITRSRFHASESTAIVVLFITMILLRHTMIQGIDVISVMLICLILYYINNKFIYSTLILLSIGLNEKVVMIFFILLWARFIFNHDRRLLLQLVITTFALLIYFIMIKYVFPHAGGSGLTDTSMFLDTFKVAITRSFSIKGIILNVLPFMFLLVLYFMAREENKRPLINNSTYFSNTDVLVLLSLFFIGHILAPIIFNIGRIVMYTFPFYLPLATLYFIRILDNTGAERNVELT